MSARYDKQSPLSVAICSLVVCLGLVQCKTQAQDQVQAPPRQKPMPLPAKPPAAPASNGLEQAQVIVQEILRGAPGYAEAYRQQASGNKQRVAELLKAANVRYLELVNYDALADGAIVSAMLSAPELSMARRMFEYGQKRKKVEKQNPLPAFKEWQPTADRCTIVPTTPKDKARYLPDPAWPLEGDMLALVQKVKRTLKQARWVTVACQELGGTARKYYGVGPDRRLVARGSAVQKVEVISKPPAQQPNG
jgi:hypothetical protein